jgi:hypothetical protein
MRQEAEGRRQEAGGRRQKAVVKGFFLFPFPSSLVSTLLTYKCNI